MPDSRSRSPPPRRDDRQRSRSPRRRQVDDRPRRSGGGFNWKEKRNEDDSRNRDDDRRLERGYRDRRDRPRSPAPKQNERIPTSDARVDKPKKEKKEKKSSAPAPTSEPMIIVNVNDRLGTKASIPCLASDPISGLFSLAFYTVTS